MLMMIVLSLLLMKQRLAENFLKKTVDREEELYKALVFFLFPEFCDDSMINNVFMVLGPSGSGRSHMIDEIVRVSPQFLERKKERIKQEMMSLSKKGDRESKEKWMEYYNMLVAIEEMLKRLNRIFFVPSFITPFIPCETQTEIRDPESVIASRLLFCYFCVQIGFKLFSRHLDQLTRHLSIQMALDVIYHDRSIGHSNTEGDSSPPPKCILLVDGVPDPFSAGSLPSTERERILSLQIFNSLKNDLHLGLFSHLLLSFSFNLRS